MKKTTAVLIFVIFAVMLSACDQAEKPPLIKNLKLDKAEIEIGDVHTDFEGVEIRIVDAVWTDNEIKLVVDWVNKTEYAVLCGEPFDIEIKNSENWSSCPCVSDPCFNLVGYELAPKATQTKTYDLTDVFDINENGNYRFKTECEVYQKGREAEGTKCMLWAEFSVTLVGDTGKEVKNNFISYEPQYIRTDGYHDGTKYPIVKIIRSVNELNAYHEDNKDYYNLGSGKDIAPDIVGFSDACAKYDDTFFENHILLMVVLEDGSGSIRHNVDSIESGTDGKLYVNIRTIVPEVCTDDMAEWHILIELDKDIDVASEDDVVVHLNVETKTTQPTTVNESGTYSSIELTIPCSWKYETEHNEISGDYCISFWPEEESEHKIKMCYYSDAFAVCGTGLEQENIIIGGYKARKGTYDNKKAWDFIVFENTPGDYAAINDGDDEWWSKYGDEVMRILSTVKIADGIISKSQAIEIAKKEAAAEYNQTDASFDTEKGLWTVIFSKENTLGGDQVFRITGEGKIIDTDYGE